MFRHKVSEDFDGTGQRFDAMALRALARLLKIDRVINARNVLAYDKRNRKSTLRTKLSKCNKICDGIIGPGRNDVSPSLLVFAVRPPRRSTDIKYNIISHDMWHSSTESRDNSAMANVLAIQWIKISILHRQWPKKRRKDDVVYVFWWEHEIIFCDALGSVQVIVGQRLWCVTYTFCVKSAKNCCPLKCNHLIKQSTQSIS